MNARRMALLVTAAVLACGCDDRKALDVRDVCAPERVRAQTAFVVPVTLEVAGELDDVECEHVQEDQTLTFTVRGRVVQECGITAYCPLATADCTVPRLDPGIWTLRFQGRAGVTRAVDVAFEHEPFVCQRN
ncbi:MAG: hypothetical protein AB2A00_27760 [Myxococcota bacterium]